MNEEQTGEIVKSLVEIYNHKALPTIIKSNRKCLLHSNNQILRAKFLSWKIHRWINGSTGSTHWTCRKISYVGELKDQQNVNHFNFRFLWSRWIFLLRCWKTKSLCYVGKSANGLALGTCIGHRLTEHKIIGLLTAYVIFVSTLVKWTLQRGKTKTDKFKNCD